jgi:hypothetical protein
MGRRLEQRRAVLGACAAAIAVTVAACGGTQPAPTPAATGASPTAASVTASATPTTAVAGSGSPTPVASPTSSPGVDPITAFAGLIADDSFATKATVTGTLSYAGKRYKITGSFEASGTSSHETRKVATPGTPAREWTTLLTTRYTRTPGGLWFVGAAPTEASDLWKLLRSRPSMTSVGPDVATGTNRIRLTSTTLEPRALGIEHAATSKRTATIDVLTTAAGAPSQLIVKAGWTWPNAGPRTAVTAALTYTFANTAAVTITRPSDVWSMTQSKMFKYRVGHPSGWDVDLSTKRKYVDQFLSDEYQYGVAYRDAARGSTLDSFARYEKTHGPLVELKRIVFVRMKNVTIDGMPGRMIVKRGVEGGTHLYIVELVTVRAGWAYSVAVIDTPDQEKADEAMALKFASTFQFP